MDRFRFGVLTIVPMVLLFIGAVMLVSANWYEYHTLGAGDDPAKLVNQAGWEPLPGSGTLSGSGFAVNYRRPRFLPHPNTASPAPTPQSATAPAIHAKAAKLSLALRDVASNSYPPSQGGMSLASFNSAANADSELAAELDVDGDHSPQANAVRALMPSIASALDTAKTTSNSDALIRLAVQLDHAA
jgi:hypothetical protein